MAVINDYVNSALVETSARKIVAPQNAQGGHVHKLVQTFEVAAGDDDGSVYRLFKEIPATAVLVSAQILNDAITGGTDYDLGLYKPGAGGDVVDKDVLADGEDLSSANSRISPADGLGAVDLADVNKPLWQLSSAPEGGSPYTVENKPQAFDIALTANTVGTGAGTITAILEFVNPG
jgi:hypothetical protein